jgi:hypothetical protein
MMELIKLILAYYQVFKVFLKKALNINKYNRYRIKYILKIEIDIRNLQQLREKQ